MSPVETHSLELNFEQQSVLLGAVLDRSVELRERVQALRRSPLPGMERLIERWTHEAAVCDRIYADLVGLF